MKFRWGRPLGRPRRPMYGDYWMKYCPVFSVAVFPYTYGMAVANVLTAWKDYDIEAFDTSAGGLGGCPYAPGAAGNVATEDVVYALRASGAVITVDEQRIIAAARQIGKVLNRPLFSRLSRIQIEQTCARE